MFTEAASKLQIHFIHSTIARVFATVCLTHGPMKAHMVAFATNFNLGLTLRTSEAIGTKTILIPCSRSLTKCRVKAELGQQRKVHRPLSALPTILTREFAICKVLVVLAGMKLANGTKEPIWARASKSAALANSTIYTEILSISVAERIRLVLAVTAGIGNSGSVGT
jgi:hypothetical protein